VERGVSAKRGRRGVVSLQRAVSAKRGRRGVSAKRVERGGKWREGKWRERASGERGQVEREGRYKERKERGYFPAERGQVERVVISLQRGVSAKREGKCREGLFPCRERATVGRGKCKERKERG
jgi:hypothetical protein